MHSLMVILKEEKGNFYTTMVISDGEGWGCMGEKAQKGPLLYMESNEK